MKYWLRYGKTGLTRYVGHLDMLHHWERILRRAQLPLAFSQGFSPHPLLSLAAPLPVGQSSLAEYLELELAERMQPAALQAAITAVLPVGLELMGAVEVPEGIKSLMSLVRFADYQLIGRGVADLGVNAQLFLDNPSCLLAVRRKGGVKEVDVRPLVHSLSVDGENRLLARLATGSTGNLRPEDLWRALAPGSPEAILRTELYLLAEDRLVTPWQSLGLEVN